ncbi:VWA domain-containing protein [Spirochaeta africana]|uniref:Mg-chelatase subunit ChlD n=1 Tax=Spirochaeta africana (strain ATCC 700263 / DSM 8902 / Z-7692) TaxID=889378 RepID=H9UM21_SPIAZ|nr:VWA domain-containing protein [Spirochaeta africana]AFG38564.1 Mg-chelatase subunit ChlD [Spirochaeta africana DSM 8902]
MFILEAPLYLLLLLIIPTGVYLRHLSPRRGGRIAFPIRVWSGDGPKAPFRLRVVLAVTHLSFWLGVAALIVALAGPGTAQRERVYLRRGIDIMLVVDVSPTMAIQDFGRENRLEATRELLQRFVSSRENDAIGVVAFGRDAALRLSPTIQHDTVLQTLDELQIFDHGDGTAIGLGLSVAALHMEHSTADHQVIILITDGDNNAGQVSPQAAADLIGRAGIGLYVIGIGNEAPAPIEFVYPETGTRYRGTMADAYNLELMNDMAERAGGRVYTAGSPGVLTSVLNEIDSLEAVERRIRVSVATESMSRYWLLAALLLLLLDFGIRKMLLREVL